MGGSWRLLLSPGQWEGVEALLDLSPKIPPLSSIISGSLMAVVAKPGWAGWILSLWHGVLLLTVANWGQCIGGRRLGLLAALILAMAPGLAEHRVEFTDLPQQAPPRWPCSCSIAGSDHRSTNGRPMEPDDRCLSIHCRIHSDKQSALSWWCCPPFNGQVPSAR